MNGELSDCAKASLQNTKQSSLVEEILHRFFFSKTGIKCAQVHRRQGAAPRGVKHPSRAAPCLRYQKSTELLLLRCSPSRRPRRRTFEDTNLCAIHAKRRPATAATASR